jgi:hypothetical protein
MTDPAHATAISLYQITCTLLMIEPTLDHIVIMKIMDDYQKDVGDAFMEIEKNHS